MGNLIFSYIAWDTWRATGGGMTAIRARQQQRLAELVAFVRANSRYYANKYAHLPDLITDIRQLPPTKKRRVAWLFLRSSFTVMVDVFQGWMHIINLGSFAFNRLFLDSVV